MAIRVDSSISLRGEYGVTIARLLKVSNKNLLVEAEAQFRPGTKLEFQLELEGFSSTMYGLGQITRVTAYANAPNRYLLLIVQFSSKDRKLFDEWIYELAQGMGSASTSARVGSSIRSTAMDSAARAELSGGRPSRAAPRPGAASASHWSVSVSGSQRGVGRAAVREALRARFAERARTRRAESDAQSTPGARRAPASRPVPVKPLDRSKATPEPPTGPSPPSARSARSRSAEAEFSSQTPAGPATRTAGGGEITVTHSPEAEQQFSARRGEVSFSSITEANSEPGGLTRDQPKVTTRVTLENRPPLVVVRYHDLNRYLADYADYLAKDATFVRWDQQKPDHRAAVSVRLVLPTGQVVACGGQVVALMPSGFGLALLLDDGQRQDLAAAARVGG